MATIDLYGIPNCDTVKKARNWLAARRLTVIFHDYKKDGADPAKVAAWIAAAGVNVVVNRRGTAYRALGDNDKAKAADSHAAVALLVQHPSMIKRPIIEHPGGLLIGFKEAEWSAVLL